MESKVSHRERRLVGRAVRGAFLRGREGKPRAVPEHLRHRAVRFEGNTGADVRGTWFPHEAPRGAVVLVHPDRRYASHWFIREGWVDALHANGFETLVFDLPGYGESRGGSTYFHEDVEAAARFAQHWGGGLPVHVVGSSLGAFAAANASPRLDFVHSLILESPYPSFHDWYAGARWERLAMRAFDAAFPTTGALLHADRNLARAAVRGRILVAAPALDEVTPAALSKRVADANPRAEWLAVEGARHLEPFRVSARYRAAVLDALSVPSLSTQADGAEMAESARGGSSPSPRPRPTSAPSA